MTTIKQLFAQKPASDVKDVTITGWVRTLRQSKTFAFMEVNDGTFFKNLQVVMSEDALSDYKELVKTGVGASVKATGTLVVTPDMPQPFELHATAVEVVGARWTIPCRRSATRWNTCAPSRTCARAPTCSSARSASAL